LGEQLQKMKQKTKQPGVRNHTLARMSAQRKKVIVALVLMGVMVIMWARILTKKNASQTGEYAITAQATAAESAGPKTKLTYVDLPCVKGRNNVLTHDFFNGADWDGFHRESRHTGQNGEVIRRSANEQLSDRIETIGKELRLEAIISGKNPQAYVGGALVSQGGKLTANYEGEQYEFKVVVIGENEVVLECKGVQLKLTITRPVESAN
jgi:hypothetical protein